MATSKQAELMQRIIGLEEAINQDPPSNPAVFHENQSTVTLTFGDLTPTESAQFKKLIDDFVSKVGDLDYEIYQRKLAKLRDEKYKLEHELKNLLSDVER